MAPGPEKHPIGVTAATRGASNRAKNLEPLACVTCRARKLKCDRTRPICTRCAKVNNDCFYPESKRKPTFKRRNVRDLEDRLAQVEGYLKEVTRNSAEENAVPVTDVDSGESVAAPASLPDQSGSTQSGSIQPDVPFDMPSFTPGMDDTAFMGDSELIALGITESLPPFEVMEELHSIYFNTQHHQLPVIHPGRFWNAFYGSPLRSPPMCLQYIMWALASLNHTKYGQYSDIFYRRSRQYVEADEMKGRGEHFITIQHAQAYSLLATYEVRRMLFTRSALNVARCTRLIQMMGLDQTDGSRDDAPPTLARPTCWEELEERRRAFWAAYIIDAHGSVATGWPKLINCDDIMTRLPSSEEAFISGKEEPTAFLDDVFTGSSYGGFASVVVTCHIFSCIMQHIHRRKPQDRPEDITNGPFWIRHRKLDSQLSSAFMFMPEKLRLPQNAQDGAAVSLNLNLHASIICLHHTSLEAIEKNGHPESLKKSSLQQLKASADQIVSTLRLTSFNTSFFKAPLAAVALYSAATVFIYLAKNDRENGLTPMDAAGLELLVQAMDAVGRSFEISRGFLQQTYIDLESNDLMSKFHVPALEKYRNVYFNEAQSLIPFIARNPVSHGAGDPPEKVSQFKGGAHPPKAQSQQTADVASGIVEEDRELCFQPIFGAVSRNMGTPKHYATEIVRRSPMAMCPLTRARLATVRQSRAQETAAAEAAERGEATTSTDGLQGTAPNVTRSQQSTTLPDRKAASTSASSTSPLNMDSSGLSQTISSGTSPGSGTFGLGNTPGENRVDLRSFNGQPLMSPWQTTGADGLFGGQMGDGVMMADGLAGPDPWPMMTGELGWGV